MLFSFYSFVADAALVIANPPHNLPPDQVWNVHAAEVAGDTEYIEELDLDMRV